jgi:hypothetical protein
MCCHNGSHSSRHENDRVAFRKLTSRRTAPPTAGEAHSALGQFPSPTTQRVTRPVFLLSIEGVPFFRD